MSTTSRIPSRLSPKTRIDFNRVKMKLNNGVSICIHARCGGKVVYICPTQSERGRWAGSCTQPLHQQHRRRRCVRRITPETTLAARLASPPSWPLLCPNSPESARWPHGRWPHGCWPHGPRAKGNLASRILLTCPNKVEWCAALDIRFYVAGFRSDERGWRKGGEELRTNIGIAVIE